MDSLYISLIQCNQHWENKKLNLELFDKLIEKINKKSKLIILPEMFHTGFSMNTNLAEKIENSTAINWLKNKASQKNIAIYTSFICEDENKFFNRGIFIFPDQSYIFYDKRKLFSFANEDKFYTKGNKSIVVDYLNWKIQLQICYDLRFPEISRNYILNGSSKYDICIYVANWPQIRSSHWNSLLQARAIENQCFVIGVNRIGTDGKGLNYCGDTRAISPLGKDLFISEKNIEKIFEVELNKTDIINIRKDLNFLKDNEFSF